MSIEGFGRATKKGIIHALIKSDNQHIALCSKIPISPDKDLNIMQVDCGNCKRLKLYADAIKDIVENKKKPQKQKNKDTSEVIIDNFNNEIIEIDFDFDPKSIKNDIPKLKEIFLDRISNLEQQFIAQSRENGSYDIVHRFSNIVFFSPVRKSFLTSCLLMLNSYKEQWTGRTKARPEWIENIKKLFSAGYVFAENCIYEESSIVIEQELIIKNLKQEIEGINSHNEELISENGELRKEINLKESRLKTVQQLAIDQQLEINEFKLIKNIEKKDSKIKRIKSPKQEKPKLKKSFQIRRLKLS